MIYFMHGISDAQQTMADFEAALIDIEWKEYLGTMCTSNEYHHKLSMFEHLCNTFDINQAESLYFIQLLLIYIQLDFQVLPMRHDWVSYIVV